MYTLLERSHTEVHGIAKRPKKGCCYSPADHSRQVQKQSFVVRVLFVCMSMLSSLDAAHVACFVTLTDVLRPNQGQVARKRQKKKRQGDVGDDHGEYNRRPNGRCLVGSLVVEGNERSVTCGGVY